MIHERCVSWHAAHILMKTCIGVPISTARGLFVTAVAYGVCLDW